MGRLSIKQRLAKAKSSSVRAEIAREWADEWEDEQRDALQINDLGQLQELTGKRFEGLQSVLMALTDDRPEPPPMDQDHTLNSPDFGRWKIVAAESDMPPGEISAVAKVRHRLLAAVWLAQESLPGASPTDIVRVFEAIGQEAGSVMVEWPEEL